MSWRYAHVIVPGPSHVNKGRPCQDFAFVEALRNGAGQDILIAAVSDGAGGALKAEVGADLACGIVQRMMRTWVPLSRSVAELERDRLHGWIGEVQAAVADHAKSTGLDRFQYSCTLLCVIAGPDCAVYAQIGDGAIVTEHDGTSSYVFWPESGEYNNMTYFVTDKDACEHLQVEVRHDCPPALGIFSDGLEQLLLRFDNRTVRSDIFRVLFDRLAREPVGYSNTVADELDRFLRSPAVVARTYDDRTLVLAQYGE